MATFPPFTLNLPIYHHKKNFFLELSAVNLSFSNLGSFIQFYSYFLINNVMLFDFVLKFETETMSQVLELI